MSAGRKIRWKASIARRGLSAILLTTLIIPVFNSNIFAQAADKEANPTQLHGGIEIDPDGIKAAVIRVFDNAQGVGTEVIYSEIFNTALTRTQDGKVSPEAIKAACQAIQKFYTLIRQQRGVPPRQVHVIGSSELNPGNLEELTNEVKNITGAGITFLDLKTEAQLSVIGTVPRRYREGGTWFDNRSHSIVFDIGSYKTKGGYQQLRQPLVGDPFYEFVPVDISIGAIRFTDEVNKAAGEDAGISKFAVNARSLSENSIKTALRNEIQRRPGLAYRKKIYLNGAIVGAMMTLLHPEDRQPFIPITIEDINSFYQLAVSSPQSLLNPNLARIRNDEVRKEVEKELEEVKSAFTSKSLLAGALILKAMSSECNFQEEGKKLLYARFSNMGVILSYLLLQAGEGPQP